MATSRSCFFHRRNNDIVKGIVKKEGVKEKEKKEIGRIKKRDVYQQNSLLFFLLVTNLVRNYITIKIIYVSSTKIRMSRLITLTFFSLLNNNNNEDDNNNNNDHIHPCNYLYLSLLSSTSILTTAISLKTVFCEP